VHYHEIGLKGRNRSDFERRLEFNLPRAVRGLGTGRVRRITGYDDECCTLLMPRRPATHATVAELDEAEALLDVESPVAEALGGMVVTGFLRASRRPADAETGRGTR
jgi:adenylyl- and sulfurtransferase ThiI